MVMNKYSTLTRSPELEPPNQMQFSVMHSTLLFMGITPQQGIQLAYFNTPT